MNSKGFTIIEILVTTAILIVLSSILIIYTKGAEFRVLLNRSALKLVADINQARMRTLSLQQLADGTLPCGYGIYFPSDQLDRYIYFADQAADCAISDKIRDPLGSEDIKTIIIESPIQIKSKSLNSVLFFAPDPETFFSPDQAEASIILESPTDLTITVAILKAGQIAIQQ